MTWPRAVLYLGIAAVLGTYYFATSPPPPAPPTPPGPPARAQPDFAGLAVESGGRRVRAVQDDGQWRAVEPAGATVASDLFAALLAAALEAPAEKVGRQDSVGAFGLDPPSARLIFERRDGSTVALGLGALNPTETAVYAALEGAPEIVLVGLNVRYYVDLVLDAASRRQ